MLTARTVAKETIRFEEVAEPALEPGHALVRVHNVTLCGTDLHIWEDDYPAELPIIQGHEFSGIVEAVGEQRRRRPRRRPSGRQPHDLLRRMPAVPHGPAQRLPEHRLHRLLFRRRPRGTTQRAGGEAVPRSRRPAPGPRRHGRTRLHRHAGRKPGPPRAGETALVLGSGPIGLLATLYLTDLGVQRGLRGHRSWTGSELATSFGAVDTLLVDARRRFPGRRTGSPAGGS